jgi:hypothetical protein
MDILVELCRNASAPTGLSSGNWINTGRVWLLYKVLALAVCYDDVVAFRKLSLLWFSASYNVLGQFVPRAVVPNAKRSYQAILCATVESNAATKLCASRSRRKTLCSKTRTEGCCRLKFNGGRCHDGEQGWGHGEEKAQTV